MPPPLQLPVWVMLALALPVLGSGEWLVRKISFLRRFSIPAPVVGGLLLASLVLVIALATRQSIQFRTTTDAAWWTWTVTAEPEWLGAPTKSANLPFLAGFFATVGLAASWQLVRRAGRQVLFFLALVSALAVGQNLIGLAAAKLLGVSPLLGLICGSMTLTGGHATTLGFAHEFEQAGLIGAQTLGMAAATMGLIAGALLAGPVGRGLIRRFRLAPATRVAPADSVSAGSVLWADVQLLVSSPRATLQHSLLILICLKGGSWISFGLQQSGVSFPVFVGTLLAAVVARNLCELVQVHWFDPRVLEAIGSIALAVFLATAMLTLDLQQLSRAVGPLLAIVAIQVVVIALFAWWITFAAMGRDYDAAVMAAGHAGFGLGSTATAMAGMKALVPHCGDAPRAFLIVPLVGGFLVDLVNAFNLTFFINLAR